MCNMKQRNHRRDRSAVAIVELAVCLPAIVLLVLASIEACTMVFVKQSLHISAYESVRTAIQNDATNSTATDRATQILNERGVSGGTVELRPANIQGLAPGTPVRVRITAPTLENTVMRLRFFSGDLESEVTMAKE